MMDLTISIAVGVFFGVWGPAMAVLIYLCRHDED
jgi:hypothetical protein